MNKLNAQQCSELFQFSVKTFCSYPGLLRTVGLVSLVPITFIADLFAQIDNEEAKKDKLKNFIKKSSDKNQTNLLRNENETIFDAFRVENDSLNYRATCKTQS